MNPIKKYLAIGPGGMDCACCFPPPGHRKSEFRKAKRKEQIESRKEMEAEAVALLNGDFEVPEHWDTE